MQNRCTIGKTDVLMQNRCTNGKTENYKQLPPYIDSSKLLNLIIIHFNKLEQWNIPYIYRFSSSVYRFGYQI